MDMGFSLNSCKRALTAVGGSDIAAAMDWAFQHNTDADFNDPLPETSCNGSPASGTSSSIVDEGVVQSLVENLGCFTPDQVRAALQETNGAADRAADWLFSHMDDLDGAIAALRLSKQEDESSSPSSSAGAAGESLPLEDSDLGKYTLSGMISHIGRNTGSGHYVAHLKRRQDDGKWVIFNDEKVALSSQPPVEHAYIYLFQRSDTLKGPLNPHY
jgi:ubiquitin carboxyl-terminal hydrolase 5/13